MMRRDAHSDLDIAKAAEKLHGSKLWDTDAARARAVSRYRDSKNYQNWLHRWQNQDADLRKSIETQKQRFELLQSLVQGDKEEGLETLSKGLQARLLTLAAEADDDELKAFMGGKGWIKNVMALVQRTVHDRYREQVLELKDKIRQLGQSRKEEGAELRYDEVLDQVDKIMGLT